MTFKLQMQLPPDQVEASIRVVGERLTGLENKAKQTERTLREGMAGAARAFGSLGGAIERQQQALARTTQIHERLTVQNSALVHGFARIAEVIEREQQAAARCSEVHQRLTAVNNPLSQGFAQVAVAIQREHDVLERIQGPAREYMADLRALDALLEKDKISTDAYAAAVTQLNRNLSQTPKPPAAAPPTVGGGIRALASSPGLGTGGMVAGALLGGAKVVEDMAHESDMLKDRYTELSNSALEFATDGRTVNSVIDQQRKLARELHTDMAPTMELFDGVGDATRKLGMTTKEQIDLSRVFGMEMTNSHKPVSEAAGVIQRLAVGLETGAGAGRQFKTIMAEYPRLADAAAKAFHTDAAGLERLIERGDVGLPQLTAAWATHTEEVVELHNRRAISIEQAARAEREDAEIAMNRGVPAFVAYNKAARDASESLSNMIHGLGEKPKFVTDVVGEISQELAEQARKWTVAKDAADGAIGAQFVDKLHNAYGVVTSFSAAVKNLADNEAIWGSAFMLGTGIAVQHGAAIDDARKHYEAMKLAQDAGAASARQVQKAHEDLASVLNGGELPATIRLWHEIHDPIDNYYRDVRALDSLLKEHSITVDQYNAKLHQLSASYLGFDADKLLGTHAGNPNPSDAGTYLEVSRATQDRLMAERAIRESDSERAAIHAEDDLVARIQSEQSFKGAERYKAELEQLNALVDRGRLSWEEYAEARQKAFAATGGVGVASSDFYAPGVDFAGAAANVNKAGIGIGAMQEELDEVQRAMVKKSQENAKKVRDAWGDGLAKIGGDFLAAARKGDQSFGDMTKHMLEEIVLLTLKMELLRAAQAGGFGAQLAQIGVGVLGGIGGGMHGFDHLVGPGPGIETPGFARGGDALALGHGGPDSKLAVLRITPGESLHVRTPAQRTEGQQSSGPTQLNVRVVQRVDPRELLSIVDSPDGERVVMAIVDRNRRGVRSYTGGGR